jgi:secondary thiamine-phosphate synthase enzyme
MGVLHHFIEIATDRKQGLYDITALIRQIIVQEGTETGLCNVYVRGATAAIMIQENWDASVRNDVVKLLSGIIPPGIWEHDLQDGNGDAHLKAGLVGPSETIPIIAGKLGLSTWQNVFLCEFDGPRGRREIVVSIFS